MTIDWSAIGQAIVALMAVLGTALSIINAVRQARKDEADVDKIKADVATIYEEMASKQAQEIKELRKELRKVSIVAEHAEKRAEAAEQRAQELSDGVNILIDQLWENRITPRWRPRSAAEVQ